MIIGDVGDDFFKHKFPESERTMTNLELKRFTPSLPLEEALALVEHVVTNVPVRSFRMHNQSVIKRGPYALQLQWDYVVENKSPDAKNQIHHVAAYRVDDKLIWVHVKKQMGNGNLYQIRLLKGECDQLSAHVMGQIESLHNIAKVMFK